jgi:hypothetical protein
VAGHDLGAVAAGFRDNFALAGLTVGANQIGRVRLVDLFNNSPGSEAMYVRRLTIGPGSTLDLNGFKLYYGELYLDPMAILIHNGGELIQSPVPELGSLLLALEGLWLGVAIGWRRTDSFRGGGVRGTYDHAFSA